MKTKGNHFLIWLVLSAIWCIAAVLTHRDEILAHVSSPSLSRFVFQASPTLTYHIFATDGQKAVDLFNEELSLPGIDLSKEGTVTLRQPARSALDANYRLFGIIFAPPLVALFTGILILGAARAFSKRSSSEKDRLSFHLARSPSLFLPLALGSAILVFWSVWGLIAAHAPDWFFADVPRNETSISTSPRLERAGQFGDSFGGLNTLFTGLALTAVLWAGWLQRTEILIQRAALGRQSFETTFFKILELIKLHRDELSVGGAGKTGPGARAVVSDACKRAAVFSDVDGSVDERQRAFEIQLETQVYKNWEYFVAPFARLHGLLLRSISDNSHLLEEERLQYASIVKAQMDDASLTILSACAVLDEALAVDVHRYGLLEGLGDEGYREFIAAISPRERRT